MFVLSPLIKPLDPHKMDNSERFIITHNSENALFFILDSVTNLEVGRIAYRVNDSQTSLPTKEKALSYALFYTGSEDVKALISKWRELSASLLKESSYLALKTKELAELNWTQFRQLAECERMSQDYNNLACALEKLFDDLGAGISDSEIGK